MLGYNHQEPRLKPRQRMTDQIRGLYDQRIQARKRKDFVESDRLAKAMEDLGFDPWNEDRWRGGALRRVLPKEYMPKGPYFKFGDK